MNGFASKKLNNIKEYNIPKEYLTDKNFSYKMLIAILYYVNYDVDVGEWFYHGFCLSEIANWSNINYRTVKAKLNYKIYKIKKVSKDVSSLYIKKPTKNFSIISCEVVNKLLQLDEMTIRLYILIQGWQHSKVMYKSQADILNMIGYNGALGNNKNKLTKAKRELIELGLINSYIVRDRKYEYTVYEKVKKGCNYEI